jgi:hypothetical protein
VWLSPKQTLERTVELAPGQSLEVDWSVMEPAAAKDAPAKDAAK